MFQEANKKRGQISIEFLIVFAFVLLVFLFLFSLITQQRAVIQNTQTYSQLQLIAQNIALQISRAALSQSGYSAQLPLLTSVGVTPYNLSITSSGTVIVTSTTAKQAVRATAFSSARGISSNPAYLAAGSNTVYNIPISNGTISIQNSYGTICIDYSCQASANQTSLISLSTQIVHPGLFNGGSALGGSDVSALQSNTGLGFSFSAWVYPTNTTTSRGITQGDSYVFRIDSPSEGNKLSWFVYIGGAIEPRLSSTTPLALNKWYHVVGTYNSSTGYMGLYINGALNSSETRAGSPTLGYCGCFNIGVGSSSDWVGMITNAQLYHFGLSANQVKALYASGISAAPINTSYLGGWWPISGNANDYSGNGDNLVTGTILFPTTAQIYASVKNPLGKAVNNLLLGFATTIGNFTNGKGGPAQVVSTYTNLNGVASVFLNQQGNNGQAFVKATAFNSNLLPEASLVAWYPLNLGQGNVEYDLSGNKNNGAFVGQPGWSSPNYIATFYGNHPSGVAYNSVTSYVGIQGVKLAPVFSEGIWFNVTGPYDPLKGDIRLFSWQSGSWGAEFSATPAGGILNSSKASLQFYLRWSDGSSTGWVQVATINKNQWYNAWLTFDGTNVNVYLNGINVYTSSAWSGKMPNSVNSLYIGGDPYDVAAFNGTLANAQFYNAVLTANQMTQQYLGGIGMPPFSANLMGWWPLDGNSNDYSGNGHNGTVYGTVSFTPLYLTIPPSQSSNGNSGKTFTASFNGVGSFIKVGNLTKINSASNWTVSFWMNSTNAYNYKNPFDANFIPSANNAGPRFEQCSSCGLGSNALSLILGTSPSNYNIFVYSATIIPNAWYHVIAARSGNTIRGYLNGLLVINNTNTKWPSAFSNVTIGRGYSSDTVRQFLGNISDVQIYNQTLTSSQASQLYAGGISGAPLPGTKLVGWWPLNGNANDYSYGGNNGTATNVVYKNTINYFPSLIQSSNYSGVTLNGQSSYLITGTSSFPTGSSARSVFAWIKLNKLITDQGYQPTIDYFGTSSTAQASVLAVNSNTLAFFGWANDYVSNLALSKGSWHFVGYTYVSGAKQVTLWLDGKSQTGALNGGLALNTVLTSHYIGVRQDCLSNGCTQINGSISDLQVYNYNLSSTQVQQLYNSGIPQSATTPIPLSWYP